MENSTIEPWAHSHTFGQEARQPGETRTLIVITLTAIMMAAEISAGLFFGSMALLADGLHMASHATALSINAFAYVFARRHAGNPRFSFGTGKVNALGGFTGAVLLATFALLMAWESIRRLFSPIAISFDHAIVVALLGLVVNGASFFILNVKDHHHHHHHHGHDEEEDHPRDHNLRSAHLHVLADALTSVLAIGALLCAKYFGLVWIDPAVGILGAILVARWSAGLLRDTSEVLLDRQGSDRTLESIRNSIEADGNARVTDLHVWSIVPGGYAAILTVVAPNPASPEDYKDRLPRGLRLVHVTVEVAKCPGPLPAHSQ